MQESGISGFAPEQMKRIAEGQNSKESQTRKDGLKMIKDIKTLVILSDGDASKARNMISHFVNRGFESQQNQLILKDLFNDRAFEGHQDEILEMLAKGNKAGLKKLIEECLQGNLLDK